MCIAIDRPPGEAVAAEVSLAILAAPSAAGPNGARQDVPTLSLLPPPDWELKALALHDGMRSKAEHACDEQHGQATLSSLRPGERAITCTFTKPTACTLSGVAMDQPAGALVKIVALVEGGAAKGAGMKVGDAIMSVNGVAPTSQDHAASLIRSTVGEVKVVVVRRDDGASAPPAVGEARAFSATRPLPNPDTSTAAQELFLAGAILQTGQEEEKSAAEKSAAEEGGVSGGNAPPPPEDPAGDEPEPTAEDYLEMDGCSTPTPFIPPTNAPGAPNSDSGQRKLVPCNSGSRNPVALELPMVAADQNGAARPSVTCASYHSSSTEGSAQGSTVVSAGGSPIEPDVPSSGEDEPELSSVKPMHFLTTEAPRSGARPAPSPLPSQKKRRVSTDSRPNP